MAVVQITKDNFKSLVLESPKPVLLDFWAVWCGPCKMIAPIVEAIAEEREDIVVGKINVDDDIFPLFGDGFHNGSDHLAGTAPNCPEVQQNRLGRFQHQRFEIVFCDLYNSHDKTPFSFIVSQNWDGCNDELEFVGGQTCSALPLGELARRKP